MDSSYDVRWKILGWVASDWTYAHYYFEIYRNMMLNFFSSTVLYAKLKVVKCFFDQIKKVLSIIVTIIMIRALQCLGIVSHWELSAIHTTKTNIIEREKLHKKFKFETNKKRHCWISWVTITTHHQVDRILVWPQGQ